MNLIVDILATPMHFLLSPPSSVAIVAFLLVWKVLLLSRVHRNHESSPGQSESESWQISKLLQSLSSNGCRGGRWIEAYNRSVWFGAHIHNVTKSPDTNMRCPSAPLMKWSVITKTFYIVSVSDKCLMFLKASPMNLTNLKVPRKIFFACVKPMASSYLQWPAWVSPYLVHQLSKIVR